MYFRYNGDNSLIGFELNGTDYYYVKNLQGDIISILDNTGADVVDYTYDAWGKLLTTTGSSASTVGVLNPFRYRSYYYDTETGLFYVGSRYYDPVVGRFINADDASMLMLAQGEVLGANLFAYCGNNPVMDSDPSGHFWERVIIAAASGAIFGLIAYNIGKAVGLSGKNLAIFTAAFVALGITIGAIWGVQILTQINQLIKPVIYFFSNPDKVYFGLKLLNFIQFEIHNPHHNKPIHFVIRLFIAGGQKAWEWWFGK